MHKWDNGRYANDFRYRSKSLFRTKDVVRWTGCSRCDSPLHPKAFRDHERYVVYGVCPKCGYYIEI